MTFAKKSKIANQIAKRAMASMGQTVALQACFNESFDKEDFMQGLAEKEKEIKKSSATKRWSKK